MKRKKKGKTNLKIFAKGKPDAGLLAATVFLSLFGLLMVYNASVVEAFQSFGDKLYYLKFQMMWLGLGFIAFFILSRFDYHIFKTIAFPLFVCNIILLILVLVPGVGLRTYGAKRWFDFGFFTFQPTETLKIAMALYFAVWLEKERSLLSFLMLVGLILGLIMLQPDLGTAIVVVGSAFLIYYLSGAQVFRLFLVSLLVLVLGLSMILISPYRRARLKTFFDPSADPLGSSYHVQQILISLGSGGLTGVGLGQSRQKYQYLPEATTDSIFAVIAEETGFLGAGLLIGVFAFLVQKGFSISGKAKDMFGKLLAAGITSWLSIQVFVNLASMVVLVPLTGIPLPLISYGGSSLVVTLGSLGILLGISRYNVNQ